MKILKVVFGSGGVFFRVAFLDNETWNNLGNEGFEEDSYDDFGEDQAQAFFLRVRAGSTPYKIWQLLSGLKRLEL